MDTREKIEKSIVFLMAIPIFWLFFNKFATYASQKFFRKLKPEVLDTGFYAFAKVFFKAFGFLVMVMSLYIVLTFWF